MRPFWQELLLSALSPILAALVGSLLVGLIVSRITEQTQQRREDTALRESLIKELAETAGRLYLSTRHFERVSTSADPSVIERERMRLDQEYLRSRTAIDALEARLAAYFDGDAARKSWHAISDLLTTRYFQLIDRAPDEYLAQNAGPEHSTLSVEQLRDPETIIAAYKTLMKSLPTMILDSSRRLSASKRPVRRDTGRSNIA